LAGGDGKRDDPPQIVCYGVDFRPTPAARAPDGLGQSPPFPPAAARCALAVVLSIAWIPSGVTSTSALQHPNGGFIHMIGNCAVGFPAEVTFLAEA